MAAPTKAEPGAKSSTGAIAVLIVTGSRANAERLAHALVDERLAACVNMIAPIRSIYRWRGRVEDARECLLIAKSQAALFPALARRAKQLHTYQVPEIIALPIESSFAPYLKWLHESTSIAAARAKAPGTSRPRR